MGDTALNTKQTGTSTLITARSPVWFDLRSFVLKGPWPDRYVCVSHGVFIALSVMSLLSGTNGTDMAAGPMRMLTSWCWGTPVTRWAE